MTLTGIFKEEQHNLGIAVIDQDKFQDLVNEAFAGIRQHYIQGTVQYLEKNHPEIMRQIKESEHEVERIWGEDNNRDEGIIGFRAVLIKWYRLWMYGVKIFKERKIRERLDEDDRPEKKGGDHQVELNYG